MSREGSLEAPTRHPIDWQAADYYNEDSLNQELERVFNICHGCRRCVNLCQAFPTLFDLVDESDTLEVDGVNKADFIKVVDECYLCDMCYMTKCPYVPPHEWNVDFPHLMLRAKALKHQQGKTAARDKFLTNTNVNGKLITAVPLVDKIVNASNRLAPLRKILEKTLGISAEATLPEFHHRSLRKRTAHLTQALPLTPSAQTTGKVALFATCYGTYNRPDLGEDFFKVYQHNGIIIETTPNEYCCGMPKLELGDLDAVQQLKEKNIPLLAGLVDKGYDLTAPVPSCVLMFKQELPLMFPDDADVHKVRQAFFDPFEYLMLRHKAGLLNTNFKRGLGDISYQVACHLRVQNIGLKTRDLLKLIPDTRIDVIERCSGHDGTYAVKAEHRDNAVKIARPVARKVDQAFDMSKDQKKARHFASDCPMAAVHVAEISKHSPLPEHPITLLRQAYGL